MVRPPPISRGPAHAARGRRPAGALLDEKLQSLLEWVLFETGPFNKRHDKAKDLSSVPLEHDKEEEFLATRWGRLMHELIVAPVPVLRAARELLHLAVYISAAEYTSTYVMQRATAGLADPWSGSRIISSPHILPEVRTRPPCMTMPR